MRDISNFTDGKISTVDALSAVRPVVGMVAGKIAGPLDVGFAAVQGEFEKETKLKQLAQEFGDIQKAAKNSDIIAREVKALNTLWETRVSESLIAAAGAATGAAGTMALFGPAGLIGGLVIMAGGMAGGFVADKAYCHFKPKPPQDAVTIAITIKELCKKGIKIPSFIASTLLLSMQGGPAGKLAEKKLKEALGTEDFNEALQDALADPQKMNALKRVIQGFESSVTKAFPLPLDPLDRNKNVGQQVADMLNAGAITATGILANPLKVSKAYTRYLTMRAVPDAPEMEVAPEVPPTPSRSRGMGKPVLGTA